ncbi:hypothetical protein [Oceanobacillus massiliensis]|uniref:hypothetical protein n=1 Tax=Oceanobacillus massiliensis TaxID=1465765 RepID=UPI003017B49D
MIWIVSLASLIVSYYFIIKSNSQPVEKIFSLLSLIFVGLTILSFLSEFFSFIIKLSFYIPFGSGVLGIILGWFGIKGDLRISLIGLNVLTLGFYIFIFLMATVGFQGP